MSNSELNHLYKCLISPGQGATGRKVTSLQLEEADLERKIQVLTKCLERDCQQQKAYWDVFKYVDRDREYVDQWVRELNIQDDEYIDGYIKWEKDKLRKKKNN